MCPRSPNYQNWRGSISVCRHQVLPVNGHSAQQAVLSLRAVLRWILKLLTMYYSSIVISVLSRVREWDAKKQVCFILCFFVVFKTVLFFATTATGRAGPNWKRAGPGWAWSSWNSNGPGRATAFEIQMACVWRRESAGGGGRRRPMLVVQLLQPGINQPTVRSPFVPVTSYAAVILKVLV